MPDQNNKKALHYIVQCVDKRDKDYIEKTMQNFSLSKSTVYNYVKQLIADGVISKKSAATKGGFPYDLVRAGHDFTYDTGGKLMEDVIFDRDISPLFRELPKNVYHIWRYAFTEMMNNAIEHSGAKTIQCRVIVDYLNVSVIIADDGIGIFKNIQQYIKRVKGEDVSPGDCAAILLAGKFSTDSERHSGEGIFFTSHVMDKFAIMSDGTVFARNNFSDASVSSTFSSGTGVAMSLSKCSKKVLKNVFDRFSDVEEGFFRTQIPIAHMFPNGDPVSRSEARRLGEIIRKFKEVHLDFSEVEEIGQAFAHELFIVWQRSEPGIRIICENMTGDVSSMIARVQKSAGE